MIVSPLRTGAMRSGATARGSMRAMAMHTTARRGAQSSTSTGGASSAATSASSALQTAGKQLGSLAERAQAMGKPLADKATQMTGVNVNSIAENIAYQFRVAGAIAKRVYIAEAMSPPTMNAITESFHTMYARASDPNYWTRIYNNGEWKQVAVYALEAYGIFKIGEMIGRRHMVGYKIHKAPMPEGAGGHH